METSGQPKYDSTSMGGGKMKQLKITKRQAALMLLELCHGFLILFAMSAVSAKCRPVSGREESNSFLAVRNRYVASDRRVCDACRKWCLRNLDRNSGSCCGIFLFLWEGIKENLLVEDSVVSMAWNCSGSVFSWSAFCVGYGDSDCSGSCSIILSAL